MEQFRKLLILEKLHSLWLSIPFIEWAQILQTYLFPGELSKLQIKGTSSTHLPLKCFSSKNCESRISLLLGTHYEVFEFYSA